LSDRIPGLALNLGRTALAKIPGLTMWEMDGAGTQLNIGSRGTDSHRSIEMNMRQNGYNTNSDIFGYPENHYTVPLQAVEEVQLVRGSAALQFGPQFGGMMNFKLNKRQVPIIFSILLMLSAVQKENLTTTHFMITAMEMAGAITQNLIIILIIFTWATKSAIRLVLLQNFRAWIMFNRLQVA
jgi:outer membrane receptor for Fe3+-dicitrate